MYDPSVREGVQVSFVFLYRLLVAPYYLLEKAKQNKKPSFTTEFNQCSC